MSRSLGSRSLTTRPSMRISPEVTRSSPATMRSKVDFPQPDGPTMTTNSPSATSRFTPLSTIVLPSNDFETFAKVKLATSLFGLDQPANEPALHRHHDDERRQHRKQRRRHHQLPRRRNVTVPHHRFHPDDGRRHLRNVRRKDGPQILVPSVDEVDYEQRRDDRLGQRQSDVPEEAHRSCTIDSRGLDELVRKGEKELPEQERRGCGCDERHDEPAVRVDQ